jgi:hypothetical protein
LSSLLNQLEGVVDAVQTPSHVILTSPPVNIDILSPQILPFKRLRTHIPKDLPSVLLDVQKLTHGNLLAHKKMLEAQNVCVSTRQALLDANLALNLMQGQAQSEDGEYEIPTVTYQAAEVTTTSPAKPTGSNTLPSPPLAPPPPPPCSPPKSVLLPKRPTEKQLKFHKYWVSQLTVENIRRFVDEQ